VLACHLLPGPKTKGIEVVDNKLLIVLIHNNEDENPSREVAENLMHGIAGVDLIQVCEQAEFSQKIYLSQLFRHLLTQLRIEDLWRTYRGRQSFNSRIKAGINFLYRIFLLLVRPNIRRREWRIREIEIALTIKHLTSWQKFQQSDANQLLVLENDAAWINGESEEIPQLLELLMGASPTYLNLAGGLNLTELGIELLTETFKENPLNDTKTFFKPITNTNCAYAINRPLVDAFISHIENFPEHKSLGADWLINRIFLKMTENRIGVTCVHSWPPILLHGSMTGISNSWHPGRH